MKSIARGDCEAAQVFDRFFDGDWLPETELATCQSMLSNWEHFGRAGAYEKHLAYNRERSHRVQRVRTKA